MRHRLNDSSRILSFDWEDCKFDFHDDVAKWFTDTIGYTPTIHVEYQYIDDLVHYQIELDFNNLDDIVMFQLFH